MGYKIGALLNGENYMGYILDTLQNREKYMSYILDGLQNGENLYALHAWRVTYLTPIQVTYLMPSEMEKQHFGGMHPRFLEVCFIELNFVFWYDMDFEIWFWTCICIWKKIYTLIWSMESSGFLGTWKWIDRIECWYRIVLCAFNHVWVYVSRLWWLEPLLPIYETSLENHCILMIYEYMTRCISYCIWTWIVYGVWIVYRGNNLVPREKISKFD